MQQMELESSALPLAHVADAGRKGCKKVTIRTVDTDVVVLAVASFSKIAPDELWVSFGVGSSFAIHEIVDFVYLLLLLYLFRLFVLNHKQFA